MIVQKKKEEINFARTKCDYTPTSFVSLIVVVVVVIVIFFTLFMS